MRSVISAVFVLTLASAASIAAAAAAQLKTDIEYGRAGDESLKLDASVPDGDGPFPVVIIVHGGGWGSGDKGTDITPLFAPLTDAKFTWFSINYRLAPANRWPACFDDVRAGIRWVKAHAAEYKGDPNRVALIGYSAGGQLAFMATQLSDPDDRVQAVVGLAPPTDFEQDLPQRGGLSKALQDLLGRPKEVDDASLKLIREIGPIHHVKPGLPPYLLLQGSVDKTVPPVQTQNFVAKLKEAGVDATLITVEGAPHRFTEWERFDPTYKGKLIGWLAAKTAAPTTAATAAGKRP
jgi:acetyl esterase/lipase